LIIEFPCVLTEVRDQSHAPPTPRPCRPGRRAGDIGAAHEPDIGIGEMEARALLQRVGPWASPILKRTIERSRAHCRRAGRRPRPSPAWHGAAATGGREKTGSPAWAVTGHLSAPRRAVPPLLTDGEGRRRDTYGAHRHTDPRAPHRVQRIELAGRRSHRWARWWVVASHDLGFAPGHARGRRPRA
jgi:hypothetical protein